MKKIINEDYKVSDYVICNEIIKRLSLPFEEWKAYKLGIIDEKGNVLRPLKTTEDRKAFTPIDNLCLRIKKLIPEGSWRLLSYSHLFKNFKNFEDNI
ncbi:MAG: hypothetical protein NZZ41_01740 [Candidatus Dojkabacteria bacterium]|nr:hypothetical protein [Candidatus Dojkabacteria bacterium]